MSKLNFTNHAVLRMSQRGIDLNDIEIVEWIGTEVEGGYLVLQKDFQAVDREMKRLRDRMRRLVGKRIVREGLTVVTAYQARRGKQRRLLRNAEERCVDRRAGHQPANGFTNRPRAPRLPALAYDFQQIVR